MITVVRHSLAHKYAKLVIRSMVILVLATTILISASCAPNAAVSDLFSSVGAIETTATTVSQAKVPQFQGSTEYPSQALLAQLYDDYLPAVVDLEVTGTAPTVNQLPFPFPFGQPNAPTPSRGEGTGWVYDADGHIVTNHHVVDGAEEIIVNFYNGLWAEGEVVASDPQSDLAVVKVTPPEGLTLQPLTVAQPDVLDVGHWVVAFGTPFGLEGSMTLGIVSAMGRGFPLGEGDGPRYTLPDVIQTDAAINPGNSGGPLLNLEGEVVGVNFAINSPIRANSGVGFAIPAGIVQRIVPALIADGAYRYPYLGVSGGTITPQLIEAENLADDARGAWVGNVVRRGPSADGGVEEGDIIVAIDDSPIYGFEELVSYLVNYTVPGQDVALTVIRDDAEEILTITVGERPTASQADDETETAEVISIGESIQIARETVESSGLIAEIESTQATRQRMGNQRVWEVTLTGDGKTATVIVHAETSDILGLNVE